MKRLIGWTGLWTVLVILVIASCGGGGGGDDSGNSNGGNPPASSLLYFSADSSTDGHELWSYDGINAPTIAANINTYMSSGSSPRDLTKFQEKLYFSAFDRQHGRALWSFDETNGHNLVADIDSVTPSNSDVRGTIEYITVFQNKLYFAADDITHGKELWVYDGINTPQMVKDFYPTPITYTGISPRYLTVYKNKLYFRGCSHENGCELWVYDGANDPYMVDDIVISSDSSLPDYLTVFNDVLYFTANSGSSYDIWAYSGTGDTYLIQNAPGRTHTNPEWLTIYKDELYFQARTIININNVSVNMGDELWKYNAINPPEFVNDLVPGSESSSPSWMTTCNGKLYFQAGQSANDYDKELWVYDGVSAPQEVSDMIPNSTPTNLFCSNSKLYYNADETIQGSGHLWVYDEVSPAIKISDLYSCPNIKLPSDFIEFP